MLDAEKFGRWTPPFEEVGPPYWDSKPVVIVGAGPSLAGFDWPRLSLVNAHILAVKSAWRDLATMTAVCGMDLQWQRREADDLARLAARQELWLPIEDREYFADLTPRIPRAHYIKMLRKQDGRLSDDPRFIECGGNSGYAAFNLAYLKRARVIVLLGFDYSGEHYAPQRYAHNPAGHNARYLPGWARIFDDTRSQIAAARMTVLNASLHSALTAFPRMTIDAALEHMARV